MRTVKKDFAESINIPLTQGTQQQKYLHLKFQWELRIKQG
jgi:hypothetical protein